MDKKSEESVSVIVKVDLLRAAASAKEVGGRKLEKSTIKVKR